MMATSLQLRSDNKKVNALTFISGSARVALVQTGPLMGVHALNGRFQPSSTQTSFDVGSELLGFWWRGTPWKTKHV